MATYRLVTVNTAPERAKRLVGRVIEGLKDRYSVVHIANIERMEDVRAVVEAEKPDVLFTASMWTPEQAQEIIATAKEIVPGLKTLSIPQGLQVEKGPDAVVEWISERIPVILDGQANL